VNFQLRGLEYNQTTSCHDSEKSSLEDVSSASSNALIRGLNNFLTVYDVRCINLPIDMQSVTTTPLNTALNGIEVNSIVNCFKYAFLYFLSKEPKRKSE